LKRWQISTGRFVTSSGSPSSSLDLTQSGLSRRLAALETHLGKPLFFRTGRGVELTDAGRVLLEAAKSGYRLVDSALETVREKEGVVQGNVRLATVHTLSYYFTADVITDFVAERPRANVSLMARSSPEVVELVQSGKADIGFVYDAAVASAELSSTALFEDEMCLIIVEQSSLGGCIDLTVGPPKLVGFPPHYALRKMLDGSGSSWSLRLKRKPSMPCCAWSHRK
jgi:LysR family transcriptional regulator, transcription activator of glutamate synthase operon